MAGDGYTVQTTALEACGKQAAALQAGCEEVAGLLAAELEALTVAAGNPAVASGAQAVTKVAVEQFLNAAAGYQHAAEQLARTAASYSGAEASSASAVHGVASRLAG